MPGMGIRDKLVLAFFILIIAPMVLLWARWQETAMGGAKLAMQGVLRDRAREVSEQIAHQFDARGKELLELTSRGEWPGYARQLGALPNDQLRLDLAVFLLTHQEFFTKLILVDRNGAPFFRVDCRPNERGVIRPFIQTGLFDRADRPGEWPPARTAPAQTGEASGVGRIHVSTIFTEDGGSRIDLIVPLGDERGTLTGALVARLRFDQLLELAARPRGETEAERPIDHRPQVIITGPDERILFATDRSRQNQLFATAFPAWQSLRASGASEFDLRPWLIHQRRHGHSPQLSILVTRNYSQALGEVEFDSYIMLLLTLLLVIVAMLAIYFLISGTTDSIRRITNGARAIATGNLDHRIEIRSHDETRVLAEAFNRMAGRLHELIRKESDLIRQRAEHQQLEAFLRIVAILSHDLKNQIHSLNLLVANMERKFDREDFREDAMRTLSEAVSNLQNLVAKLSDPLTPARLQLEPRNLSSIVRRVIDRTAVQVTDHFHLQTNLHPDAIANVESKAIERVVENLIINAIQAMPNGGSLLISTRRDGDNAIISVADTGVGMSEEFIRERLFRIFASTKKKGWGIGLYSCLYIVEQHGGRIDVASQVGRGTEFSVILPIKGNNTSSLSDSSGDFMIPMPQLKNQAD